MVLFTKKGKDFTDGNNVVVMPWFERQNIECCIKMNQYIKSIRNMLLIIIDIASCYHRDGSYRSR